MNRKKLFQASSSAILAGSAISAPIAVQAADQNPFSDIKEGHSTYESVTTLAKEGIINGYPDGTYRPDVKLSKKQAAILFSKSLKLELPDEVEESDLPFDSVNPNSREAPYLKSLLDKGIIVEEDHFTPNAELTREEMAEWLMRAFDLKALDNQTTVIPDFGEVNADYEQAVISLYHNNITKGMKDGSFSPKDTVNRGQFAIFLFRSLTKDDIDRVQEFDDLNIALGETPSIPKEANVLLTDGSVMKKDIQWDPSTLNLNEPGTYTLTGLVQGTLEKVTITITVSRYQIESVESLDPIEYTLGEELELPEKVDVTFKNDKTKAFPIIWDDKEFSSKGSFEVGGEIEGLEKDISVIVIAEEPKTEIESVEANNLREVTIELSRLPKDEYVLTEKSSYKLESNEDVGVSIKGIQVDKEAKTITLTTNERIEDDRILLTLDQNIVEEENTKVVQVEDDTSPSLIKVQPIGPKQIQITFSEPMDVGAEDGDEVLNRSILSSIQVDQNSVQSIHSYDLGRRLLVTFEDRLPEGKVDLSFDSELKDYNGNRLVSTSYSFDQELSRDFPKLSDVTVVHPHLIKAEFEKPVEFSYDDAFMSTFIYVSTNDKNIEALQVKHQNQNEIWIYTKQDHPVTDESTLRIAPSALIDLWNHTNDVISEDLSVGEDTVKPKLTGASLINGDANNEESLQIHATFSEPVQMSDLENSFTFEDSNGTSIAITSVERVTDEPSTYKLTLDKKPGTLKEDQYNLTVTDFEDMSGNEMQESSVEFEAKSVNAPKNFQGSVFANQNKMIFRISFQQSMQTSGDFSVEDLGQYELTIEDKRIVLNELRETQGVQVDLETYNNGENAELIIQYSEDATESWKEKLQYLSQSIQSQSMEEISLVIGKVANSQGVRTDGFYNTINLSPKEEFKVESVEAVNPREINIKVNNEVYYLNQEDFVAFADENGNQELDQGERIYIEESGYANHEGSSTITLKLTELLESDARFDGEPVYITTSNVMKTKNLFQQTIEPIMERAEDGIAASIQHNDRGEKMVSVHEDRFDEGVAYIQVPLTEDIDETTVNRLTFANDSYPVEQTFVEDGSLYLQVSSSNIEDLVGQAFIQESPLSDQANNIVDNLSFQVLETGDEISPE
ncbi:S-layer homology domain-containing protein [Pontibacillus marinus]|uniref:SLH domain-containing protein n=1 Tax=Pontibacillus marinus BH030004 = DSM 16465 TaxID=1385511 RepID=A0A0A5GGD7_9BACI|nr:S-layer homology domain-containing protein [Pontibacillus marinus]KGX91034.1 hypothetical protein N783_13430 [Pontibacillus marinus BH030004 = DSM 16465]